VTTDRTFDYQIGKRLRQFRQSLGDRQADFAARVGKERSTIAKYERGERRLTLSDILEMAERLRYPPTALMLKLLPETEQHVALDTVLRALIQNPSLIPTVLTSLQTNLQAELREDAGNSGAVVGAAHGAVETDHRRGD
jgi:transcriptional regulator with XRE-family HTH domain